MSSLARAKTSTLGSHRWLMGGIDQWQNNSVFNFLSAALQPFSLGSVSCADPLVELKFASRSLLLLPPDECTRLTAAEIVINLTHRKINEVLCKAIIRGKRAQDTGRFRLRFSLVTLALFEGFTGNHILPEHKSWADQVDGVCLLSVVLFFCLLWIHSNDLYI